MWCGLFALDHLLMQKRTTTNSGLCKWIIQVLVAIIYSCCPPPFPTKASGGHCLALALVEVIALPKRRDYCKIQVV